MHLYPSVTFLDQNLLRENLDHETLQNCGMFWISCYCISMVELLQQLFKVDLVRLILHRKVIILVFPPLRLLRHAIKVIGAIVNFDFTQLRVVDPITPN